jgi:hypothetical protein
MRSCGNFARRVGSFGLLSAAIALAAASSARATVLYSNGFETNTTDWQASTRVPPGTNGITSASGSFHAQVPAGSIATPNSDFGRWGGYNYGAGNAVPTSFQEYKTSVDIYLNVSGGFANDSRFDFDSAINNSSGTFMRDFIFNAGFYNSADNTGPGAGTNRFVISASNNAQRGIAFAKNPARSPIAISSTGWYTFEHHFYDNGGFLAVDLNIFDPFNTLINTWTLNTTDLISGTGGNRYGWFDTNEFAVLAFDNASLETITAPVPEPMSFIVWGLAASTIGGLAWYRRAASGSKTNA